MRSRLPRLPRRRSRWQRITRRTLQGGALGAGQLLAGIALAFTAIAVGNTTDTPPTVIVLAVAVIAGLAIWGDVERKKSRRRNPSTGGKLRNQWSNALIRRFRRG